MCAFVVLNLKMKMMIADDCFETLCQAIETSLVSASTMNVVKKKKL